MSGGFTDGIGRVVLKIERLDMYSYNGIKSIYERLGDETSKRIFWKRLEYSLSGRKDAIAEMVDQEIFRYASKDQMFCLLRWLSEQTGNITLFGAGFAGWQICSVLHRHKIKVSYIADNNRTLWDTFRQDIKVISPDKIEKDSIVVIAVNSYTMEILEQLLSLGISEDHIFVPSKPWWMGDDPQYFDSEIMRPGADEIFVDGGSLDGGDSINFIQWCQGRYKAVYAFEPDAENREKLYKTVAGYSGITVLEDGLWSEKTQLHFIPGHSENCTISDRGQAVIQVTSIDKRLKEEKVTFIKLDIEGSEMEALTGAEDVIKKHSPRLAVCVYHKPEDILDIPQKILELNPNYTLYLRHYSYVDTETVLYAI